MERKDYLDGRRRDTGESLNAANLHGPERFDVEIKHRVVLSGTPEEVSVLMRGLEALSVHAKLNDTVAGGNANSYAIAHFERLHEEIATENLQGL